MIACSFPYTIHPFLCSISLSLQQPYRGRFYYRLIDVVVILQVFDYLSFQHKWNFIKIAKLTKTDFKIN